MAMASGLYVPAFRDALDTSNIVVDFLLDTNKVDLYLDAKTPNFDTDASYDATNEVATATGYTRDNMTVASTTANTATWASAAGILKYTWTGTVVWAAPSTFTARGMIIHAAAGNFPLVAVTFGSDFTCTAGTFTITPNASGIFTIDMVP